MRRFLLLMVFSVMIVSAMCNSVSAERWVVYDYCYWGNGSAGSIYFDFDGQNLMLGSKSYSWNGYTEKITSTLLLSGTWAACGTIQGNMMTPDPYAQFVATPDGTGSVSWLPGTPQGYTAPLIIGARFDGSGAASYEPSYDRFTASAVVWTRVNMSGISNRDSYFSADHTFYATCNSVPELSSLFALSAGIGSIGGIIIRKRK